jgi:hypothetical protein
MMRGETHFHTHIQHEISCILSWWASHKAQLHNCKFFSGLFGFFFSLLLLSFPLSSNFLLVFLGFKQSFTIGVERVLNQKLQVSKLLLPSMQAAAR